MSGLFVTFEGIDGCGKSTQVALAASALKEKKIPCLVTREPGGTKIAEQIRTTLLSPDNSQMCNECEALLYFAARAQHCKEVIGPALARGEVVLCDRFQEATFAYQGYGRGFSMDTLLQMNAFATAKIAPALTFVFDVDVDVSIERLKKTDKLPDRLESSGRDFFCKVRDGYLSLAIKSPKRIVLLQGDETIDGLSKKVLESIFMKLQYHKDANK
jgi:dTMP kinase